MPDAQALRRSLILATILAVAATLAVFTADRADAAKTAPTFTLIGACDTDMGAGVSMTVDGKGRWAQVELQVSFDGTNFDPVFADRVEKGVPRTWFLGGDWAVFRARSVRKNGTPTSDWSTVGPVVCAS
ncbi:MAG TPA: hypothetical protein VJ948_06245 [Acidimicrobiia bacterium]|nr:hypothetical protein [Acidimicrobiia bacterium]